MSLLLAEWDRLEALIAELIFAENIQPRTAIAHTCNANPESAARSLMMAVVSLAANTDEHDRKRSDDLRLDIFRCVNALVADITTMSGAGMDHGKCRDISDFWLRTHDTFFSAAVT